MAQVFPFQPYRYSASAGSLDTLVTQPYDKISPTMQQRYLSLSPYNLVRVILGQRRDSDNDTDNVYTRAAAHLNSWLASGILVQDKEPAFYAYSQEFEIPDTAERLVRAGFIGLGAVEEYEAGVVHRHEKTLSGPKKDRMELLRHARSHFGQVFMLYPDADNAIDAILAQAMSGPADAEVTDEYGTVHRLWRISDTGRVAGIQQLMSGKKLAIADGHHRYETALAFAREHPELRDAQRVMMTFVNMYSPGLRILATHRLLTGLPSFSIEQFLQKTSTRFRCTPLKDTAELKARWSEPHENLIRLGVAAGQSLYLLERDRRDGDLDVSVLHGELLAGLLGIDEAAVREERNIRYARGLNTAVAEIRNGAAQVAFLLEPATVEQVASVSFAGGVMPQKSTDFYPKLLSGLTIYRIEE